MSSTQKVRTLVGVALASSVVLLGGCSSASTVANTRPSTSATDSSPAPASGQTNGNAAGGSAADDPGCKAALSDEPNALNTIDPGDPDTAKVGFKNLADKLHSDAGQSKVPAAAAAINKLGDDYSALATNPAGDDSVAGNDSEAVGKACE